MKRIKSLGLVLVAALLFFGTPISLFSFEWPLEKTEIVATFGENRHGDFLKGIEVVGSQKGITPVEQGEIIFHTQAGTNLPHRLHTGLGNMVVLQHERGIRSVYGHLESPVKHEPLFARAGEIFGQTGSSGIVDGPFLYLQIIDSEVSRFVNPLLSLPIFSDDAEPFIERIVLEKEDRLFVLGSGTVVPKGTYILRVMTYDTSSALSSFRPMAPYSIKIYINGEEKQGISFESIAVSDGKAVPAGRTDLNFNRLYDDKWEMVPGEITLHTGEVLLEVVVSDFNGNETVRDTRIVVIPE